MPGHKQRNDSSFLVAFSEPCVWGLHIWCRRNELRLVLCKQSCSEFSYHADTMMKFMYVFEPSTEQKSCPMSWFDSQAIKKKIHLLAMFWRENCLHVSKDIIGIIILGCLLFPAGITLLISIIYHKHWAALKKKKKDSECLLWFSSTSSYWDQWLQLETFYLFL